MALNCTSIAPHAMCAKFARAVMKRAVVSVFALTVSGCGGSSGADDADPVLVSVAGNPNAVFVDVVDAVGDESNVTGAINLGALASDITGLSVVMPEDTLLNLALTQTPLTDTLEIVSFPESGAAVLVGGVLEYTPDANFFGRDVVRIESNSVGYSIEMIVFAVNDAPVIVGDISRVAEQGVTYRSRVNVRNVDRDLLEFSSSNLPSWLTLDAQTGRLSGTPQQRHVGLHEGIRLIVRDSEGLDDSLNNVVIEVLDVNDAPTLNTSQFPSQIDARESVVVNVFPDDIDGDSVSLVVEPNDFVDSFVTGGTVIVTAEDVLDVTDINLVLIATDQLGNITREVVSLILFPLTDSGRGRTLQGKKQGSGIHLVVLGDGYREDQQQNFREDVEFLIQTMAEDPAVALHLSAWNIHMIEMPSVDSGIDDNFSVDVRDTAFDSGYFCLSVARLICGNNNTMFNVALDEYPNVDELVMLVNDTRYGGSGGSVAVASARAPEIALHELGHSFAGLADEYVDNEIPALGISEFEEGLFPNVTRIQDPELVPWSVWVDITNTIPSQAGDDGVGVFEGGFYDANAFFRPTFNSRMRSFDRPFGSVGGEAWALSVYRQTNPVASFSPRINNVLVGESGRAQFTVIPIFGPNIQELAWSLNGELLVDAVNETELTLQFQPGAHVLTLSVSDITGAIRQPGPHAAQFLWRWDIAAQ